MACFSDHVGVNALNGGYVTVLQKYPLLGPGDVRPMASSLKALVTVLVVALVVAGAYYTYTAVSFPGPATGVVPTSFAVNGKTFRFNYTATNSTEWAKGLMNARVTPSTTMLFMFPYSSEWGFWMYDTNTTLDMIWINATGSSGQVVYVVTSAQPCYVRTLCTTYTPTSPANFVVEAKAGFVQANNIKIGSSIRFD